MHSDDQQSPQPRKPVRHRERPKRPANGDGQSLRATEEYPSPSSEYEVGYGRPPQHSRFKPGQSGNPKGRPRGSKSPFTLLREELRQPVTMREGDKVTSITKLEAIMKRIVNDTLGGKVSPTKLLFPILHVFEAQDASVPDDRNLSRSDEELLRNLLKGFDDE